MSEREVETLSKELHNNVIKNFRRRKVIVKELDEIWSVDLIQLDGLKDKNDGYSYILAVLDCFSRYAWTEPLKGKTAKEVLEAMKRL